MLHAAPNRQDTADALIADDAGQRRSNRKCALNHIQVVHIDRRVLDTDQHLTRSRSRRLRHVGKLEHFRRFAKGLDQRCTHWRFFSIDSEAAEIDEVATGERAARLLQAAAGREIAKVDRHEAEALDHALDEFGRLWVIPGDEDDAAATILYGSFIEASGDDRIERLHDPGARRQAGYHFARPLATQVGQHEFGGVLDEWICRVDEYSAVPRWQAP